MAINMVNLKVICLLLISIVSSETATITEPSNKDLRSKLQADPMKNEAQQFSATQRGSTFNNRSSKSQELLTSEFFDLFFEIWRFRNSTSSSSTKQPADSTKQSHRQLVKFTIPPAHSLDLKSKPKPEVDRGPGSSVQTTTETLEPVHTVDATAPEETEYPYGGIGNGTESETEASSTINHKEGSTTQPSEVTTFTAVVAHHGHRQVGFNLPFANWLRLIFQRIKRMFRMLFHPLDGGQAHGFNFHRAQISPRSPKIDPPNGPIDQIESTTIESVNRSTIETESRMVKRQVDEREMVQLDDSIKQSLYKAPNCIELNQSQKNKCRSMETTLSSNLNNSFPGTLDAIEGNCHHLSFLLANCWPDQLAIIKSSLNSWNESLFENTDFPLPKSTLESNKSIDSPDLTAVGCGVTPSVSGSNMDKISWMWLNLCMDKKFRYDYVDNFKCLNQWTQDRARSACRNDYSQILAYANMNDSAPKAAKSRLRRQLKGQTSRRAIVNMPDGEKENIASSLGVSESERTLCCIFDSFLRCVHVQAVRDCGRIGGQAVVNFFARIGNDDMKHICRRDLRAMLPSSKQPGSWSKQRTKGDATSTQIQVHSSDKHPFIDGAYCTNFRAPNLNHKADGGVSNDRTRLLNSQLPSGSRQTNGRNASRDPSAAASTQKGQLSSGAFKTIGPRFAVISFTTTLLVSLMIIVHNPILES